MKIRQNQQDLYQVLVNQLPTTSDQWPLRNGELLGKGQDPQRCPGCKLGVFARPRPSPEHCHHTSPEPPRTWRPESRIQSGGRDEEAAVATRGSVGVGIQTSWDFSGGHSSRPAVCELRNKLPAKPASRACRAVVGGSCVRDQV